MPTKKKRRGYSRHTHDAATHRFLIEAERKARAELAREAERDDDDDDPAASAFLPIHR